MPSDVKHLEGKKFCVDNVYLVQAVRQRYPTAVAEGSCGSYSFTVGAEIVAEAWMHSTRRGQWWLRIKDSENRRSY